MFRIDIGRKISDEELIEYLHKGAKAYALYADTSLLFICQKSKESEYIFYEMKFWRRNFMHLTGIRSKTLNAEEFFDACLTNPANITIEDCTPIHDVILRSAKVSILYKMFDFKNSKLYKIGDVSTMSLYNTFDIATGNSEGLIGYSQPNPKSLPMPITLINAPISDYCKESYKIMFVLQKQIMRNKYRNCIYEIKKGLLSKEQGLFSPELRGLIEENILNGE